MLAWLRRNSAVGRTAAKLYGSAVAQARSRAFYAAHGVRDTAEARFEMIVVHIFLVLERLRAEGGASQPLGQAVLEAFLADMDDTMREIGVSDLGVPRRIKKTAAAVQERFEDLRSGLAQPTDVALAASLARHVGVGPADGAWLAGYVRQATGALARVDRAAVLAGEVSFPLP